MWSIVLLLLAVSLASANHGKLRQDCRGNPCHPVLVGPLFKDIAKDFCSYYLKYPKHTTATVTNTVTATGSCTIPVSTVDVTATTQMTVPATITITETVPGGVTTQTVTETATAMAMGKREPKQNWSPPKGSGSTYKPPALAQFPPSVVSAACSCIVTPTIVTFTSTVKATSTVKISCTQTVVKSTATTVTVTVTSTATFDTTSVRAKVHALGTYRYPTSLAQAQ